MSEPSSAALPAERIELVRAFVQDRQRATVSDIVDQFGVSPATARRMLTALADRGDVRRVRGGAGSWWHAHTVVTRACARHHRGRGPPTAQGARPASSTAGRRAPRTPPRPAGMGA